MAGDLSYKNLEVPHTPETPSSAEGASFERGAESAVEKKVETAPREPVSEPSAIPVAPAPVLKNAQQIREEQIDRILSDGLEDIFLGLSPQKQSEFRTEGEVTVKKINQLMSSTRVKVKEIVALIKKWLAVIPGVNKFFLEQEAKIKADKIITLK